MQERFGAPALWKQLLQKRWKSAGQSEGPNPRSDYARREVIERWGLSSSRVSLLPDPKTLFACRVARDAPRAAPGLLARLSDPCHSPDPSQQRHPYDKENTTPNTAILRVPGRRWRGHAISSPASADSSHPFCSARLKQDLFQLMMGSDEGVGAFPDSPGDFAAWSGYVTCNIAGSLHGGSRFTIKLHYDCSASGNVDMPTITFTRPRCFHPNISVDGTVCAKVLSKRCTPVDTVRTLLLRVRELLSRPCFAVAPTNKVAAALWYGDRETLKRYRRQDEWLHAPISDLNAPPLRTAFSESAIHG
jgi:ubiquitin-protein ligase